MADPPHTSIHTLLHDVRTCILQSDLEGASTLLQRVLHSEEASHHDRMHAHGTLAHIAQMQGDLPALERHTHVLCGNVLDLPSGLRAQALRMRALLPLHQGNREEHHTLLQEARDAFALAGQSDEELRTLAQHLETFVLMGEVQRAHDMLTAFLAEHNTRLSSHSKTLFKLLHAIYAFRLAQSEETRDAFYTLLREAAEHDHTRVVTVVRMEWAKTLLHLTRFPEAIHNLNNARLEAVGASDPILYLHTILLLAQAYISNDQRPEAYGTLLRAKLSLTQLLGPESAQTPQFVLDELRKRWTPQSFDAVAAQFHATYTTSPTTPSRETPS